MKKENAVNKHEKSTPMGKVREDGELKEVGIRRGSRGGRKGKAVKMVSLLSTR